MPKIAGILIIDPEERTNDLGNKVWNGRSPYEDRYFYDFDACSGWTQFDTWQDASYFGIWVEEKKHIIVTYAEGDLSIVECVSEESYHAELKSMAEAYGSEQKPALVTIDDKGNVTKYYDKRPE